MRDTAALRSSDRSVAEGALGNERGTRVVELFAGVGGFHVGLAAAGWRIVWANQWEPSTKRAQHAFDVYRHRFPEMTLEQLSNLDIRTVAADSLPEHELLVGGFPCQDYSVAKPLPQAAGIQGKKGVLWWEIYRLVRTKLPPMVLLENVDRLLSSPATHRGRDFAIILACLDALGYTVEWRAVNAADYGFPQRRRRVFICARRYRPIDPGKAWAQIFREGVLARALPVRDVTDALALDPGFALPRHRPFPSIDQVTAFDTSVGEWVYDIGAWDMLSPGKSMFRTGGLMSQGQIWTHQVTPDGLSRNRTPSGRKRARTLGDVVRKTTRVPVSYLIPAVQHSEWERHKKAKAVPRSRGYSYSEGSMSCPDDRTRASRTIVTGEGGSSPSRFKHLVHLEPGDRLDSVVLADGTVVTLTDLLERRADEFISPENGEVWRRLTPEELEELNGFRRGWTRLRRDGHGYVSDTRRAFLMGNAVVVGIVQSIGDVLLQDWRE